MTVDISVSNLIALGAIGIPILVTIIILFLKSNKSNFTKLTENIDAYHLKTDETTTKLAEGQRTIERNYLDRFKETNENITNTKDKLTEKLEDISETVNLLYGEHKSMVCMYQNQQQGKQ